MDTVAFPVGADKAHVKGSIMGSKQHPFPTEGTEGGKRFSCIGRALDHGIGDAGELYDIGGDIAAGMKQKNICSAGKSLY